MPKFTILLMPFVLVGILETYAGPQNPAARRISGERPVRWPAGRGSVLPFVLRSSTEILPDEGPSGRGLQEPLESGRAAFVEELHQHHDLPGRVARGLW